MNRIVLELMRRCALVAFFLFCAWAQAIENPVAPVDFIPAKPPETFAERKAWAQQELQQVDRLLLEVREHGEAAAQYASRYLKIAFGALAEVEATLDLQGTCRLQQQRLAQDIATTPMTPRRQKLLQQKIDHCWNTVNTQWASYSVMEQQKQTILAQLENLEDVVAVNEYTADQLMGYRAYLEQVIENAAFGDVTSIE